MMGDKKITSKSSENGDTDGGEYEDDFEKDLEWLINEEEKRISDDIQNHDENEDDVDVESIFGKDLVEGKEYMLNSSQEVFELEKFVTGEDGTVSREIRESEDILKDEGPRNEIRSIYDFETKRLEQASDSESESSCQESKVDQEDLEDDEDIKRYILDKIEEANKLLLTQEPLDETKERKLKFKDDLVDLEVPSLEVVETARGDLPGDKNISGRLSQLRISTDMEQEDISLSLNGGTDDEHKDGKILVERDGKFELLSIRDIESQGFFPPLSVSFSDIETQHISPKTSYSTSFGTICLTKDESLVQTPVTSSREGFIYVPQPPAIRPSSAINMTRNMERRKSPRRVQSANVGLGIRSSTYSLSPRQKELQKQIEQRKEKLRKEEEIRKRRLEDQKKRENDMVFKAWLQKKKGQMQEEKRIQRAKELEDLSSRQESRNPEEAYRSWLKKKQEEQMKEKHIQDLKQQEECMFYLPRTMENERAYKQWLRKKRREKREEQLAAKEHSKQLRQEARRAKQIENILCSISEPRSLRFTDQYS